MNNNYLSYKEYVESTDYYKELSTAIDLSNEMIDNIESLIEALNRNNGDLIISAITELEQLKKDVESFLKHYIAKKNDILEHADAYDLSFNNKKNTIGSENSQLIKSVSENNKIIYTNTVSKIKSVDIDNDTGYIRLEKVISNHTYVFNDPNLNINSIIGCRPEILTSLLASKSIESVNHTSNTLVFLYNLNGLVNNFNCSKKM